MKHISSLTQLLSQYFTPAELIANRQCALISAAIEIWRVDHNMTQKQFADFLDVSQAMVSKWESGEYNFSVKALSEISCKLDIPIEKLFSGNLKSRVYHIPTFSKSRSLPESPLKIMKNSNYSKVAPKFDFKTGGAA